MVLFGSWVILYIHILYIYIYIRWFLTYIYIYTVHKYIYIYIYFGFYDVLGGEWQKGCKVELECGTLRQLGT